MCLWCEEPYKNLQDIMRNPYQFECPLVVSQRKGSRRLACAFDMHSRIIVETNKVHCSNSIIIFHFLFTIPGNEKVA